MKTLYTKSKYNNNSNNDKINKYKPYLNYLKIKSSIRRYWTIYFIAIIITFVIKYISRINDSDAFIGILAPTARWASAISGISFEYLPHMGYVNHFHQFLIAPACSGIRFMLLTFLMCIFSFLYQIENTRKGYLWFIFSAGFSYVSTIFVNGIRIIASIYVPIQLESWKLMDGWLNQDRLHTIIGTTVYFSSLLIIYLIADFICIRIFIQSQSDKLITTMPQNNNLTHSNGFMSIVDTIIVPSFWYLLIVLALPLLSRIYHNDWAGFGQYATLIICTCSSVMLIILIILMRRLIRIHRQ